MQDKKRLQKQEEIKNKENKDKNLHTKLHWNKKKLRESGMKIHVERSCSEKSSTENSMLALSLVVPFVFLFPFLSLSLL